MNELLCALIGFVAGVCVKDIAADAWAYVVDPDARTSSSFKYPSGAPMSVRDAKRNGLI